MRPVEITTKGRIYRLLTVGAIACVLLGLLASAACLRSYYQRDWIDLYDGGYVTSESGHLVVWSNGRLPSGYRRATADMSVPRQYTDSALSQANSTGIARQLGFGFKNLGRSTVTTPSGRTLPPAALPTTMMIVPYWLPIALIAAASIVSLWLARRRLRTMRGRAGLCRRCGYDLRASPDRCPECGTSINESGIHSTDTALPSRASAPAQSNRV